jgi:hypothetical protein
VANPEPGRSSLTTSLVAVIVNGERVEIKTSEVDSKSGTKARGSDAPIGNAGGGDAAGPGNDVKITPGTGFWYVVAEPVEIPLRPPPTHPGIVLSGDSIDQVVAILGQPTTIIDLGSKRIVYIFENLKATFVDGKLTDVQ